MNRSSQMQSIEVQGQKIQSPASWSFLATQLAAQKYFRRVPHKSRFLEKSVDQMIDRVVRRLLKAAKNQSPKDLAATKRVLELNELYQMCRAQKGLFNSPVWFNYGVFDAYGIEQDVAVWTWDQKTKTIVHAKGGLKHPQISACFIQSVDDSLESIYELVFKEAMLFKFGSGSGTNFSSLRSRYELIQGGGEAAGVLHFLEVFDRSAAAIKSGGTTRRAAKMVILDVDHPEVEEFIEWKVTEEKKAQSLIQGGFSAGFEGEAYRTVSGQNSNNSLRLSDQFMRRLESGGEWSLRSRSSPRTVVKKVKARELFRKIAQAAWTSADPGVQFSDTINRWHTCPRGGEIRASNPCSEYVFLDETACNLSSLNLNHFADSKHFLFEEFVHACQIFIRAQENLIDDAGYPSKAIAENSHRYRTLGLGFTGLGSILMKWGIGYDSEQGRGWASLISAAMTAAAYLESIELAKERGPFTEFKKNKIPMLSVLSRHNKHWHRRVSALTRLGLPERQIEKVSQMWARVQTQGKKFGFRNAQVTLLAPTGTIGLVMDSITLGIEPEFSLLKTKTFAGGGSHQSFCEALIPALENQGFTVPQIEAITQFAREHGTLQSCPELTRDQQMVFQTAMEISPQGHLKMMEAVQPFISGAISKTINMPTSATVEDIETLLLQAWKMGLKSVAIYRNHSKSSQPLQALAEKKPLECETCS